jgi:hypothetical protein
MHGPLKRCVAAVFLLATIGPVLADEVPVLNVEPVCRGIAQQASTPAERGGPDLAFAQCIESEQATRQRLAEEWSTFVPADKANCVGEAATGGEASYTDLFTCLEMARDVRKLNRPAPPGRIIGQ